MATIVKKPCDADVGSGYSAVNGDDGGCNGIVGSSHVKQLWCNMFHHHNI